MAWRDDIELRRAYFRKYRKEHRGVLRAQSSLLRSFHREDERIRAHKNYRLRHPIPKDFNVRIESVTELQWAYLAGIIDGEGNLGVYFRSSRHRGTGQKTPAVSYAPRLQVSNTNREIIMWLIATFGGSLLYKKGTKRCKPQWRWHLNGGGRIQEICRHTLPYMIIKKHQAELVLRFPFNAVCNQYTAEKTTQVQAVKEGLYAETLMLNKRGPVTINAVGIA